MVSVKLQPIGVPPVLKEQVYRSLRDAIARMDIYSGEEPPRLDERALAEELGVSRTPIREAITCLEQEGLVISYPRRGTFVVRKSKAEILEIIWVWAALEGMAARLATEKASDSELASMRKMFATFDQNNNQAKAHIDEYSDTNIAFHQRVIQLSKCKLLMDVADGLFIHMRAIRRKTITERDRVTASIIDHMKIIEALETRDAALSAELVQTHAMNLAEHIKQYVDYLD